MKRLLIAAALVAVLLFPAPGGAAHNSLPTWQLSIEKTCPGHYQGIAFYRGKTWRLERKMGARITTASYAEHLVGNCEQVVPFVKRWQTIATKRWKQYKAYLKQQRELGVPPWFYKQALCVHSHEGSWSDTGDPYWGGMQFALSTWHRAGGSGLPSNASPKEQIYRAYQIWKQDGGSWREWPNTARMCGLL